MHGGRCVRASADQAQTACCFAVAQNVSSFRKKGASNELSGDGQWGGRVAYGARVRMKSDTSSAYSFNRTIGARWPLARSVTTTVSDIRTIKSSRQAVVKVASSSDSMSSSATVSGELAVVGEWHLVVEGQHREVPCEPDEVLVEQVG